MTDKNKNNNKKIMDEDEKIGRKITKILRHGITNSMTSDGYMPVKDISKMLDIKLDEKICKRIIEKDNKQRMEYLIDKNNIHMMRACQGHSNGIKVSDTCVEIKINDFKNAYHATTSDAWKYIQKDGLLLPMKRNAVHFSPDISKTRYGKVFKILLSFDLNKFIKDGNKLYLSNNNVILSECPVDINKYISETHI